MSNSETDAFYEMSYQERLRRLAEIRALQAAGEELGSEHVNWLLLSVERMQEDLTYLLWGAHEIIPRHTREGLTAYRDQGVPAGGFLTAVLINDLEAAVSRADPRNLIALGSIVRFIQEEMPSNCWGSREIVEQWISAHKPKEEALR